MVARKLRRSSSDQATDSSRRLPAAALIAVSGERRSWETLERRTDLNSSARFRTSARAASPFERNDDRPAKGVKGVLWRNGVGDFARQPEEHRGFGLPRFGDLHLPAEKGEHRGADEGDREEDEEGGHVRGFLHREGVDGR